jgi:hypothetical protein
MTEEKMNLFWKQREKPHYDYSEKENNVTHAFLSTVKKEPIFLQAVLKMAGIKEIFTNGYDVYFQVGKKTRIQTLNAENKYLLFISSKYNNIEYESDEEKGTIPDGLIIDDNTSVLVECKVASRKDSGQLRRYNEIFYKKSAVLKEIYWEDIYGIARQVEKKGKRSVGTYLVKQFSEYMEIVNMAGFDGIPFFKADEAYDKNTASKILNRLGVEIKPWLEDNNFILGERPKTATVWDYFYDKNIKEKNPRKFPHYSIYIFPESFGVDMLFHKQELRKILKNEKLKNKFYDQLEKLAEKSPDYFFRFVHYRLLRNKGIRGRARTGKNYHTLEFKIQLSRFIKKNENNWREKITDFLELLLEQESKQITILKQAYYQDKIYEELDSGEKSINFIKDVVKETKNLNNMVLDLYYEKNK